MVFYYGFLLCLYGEDGVTGFRLQVSAGFVCAVWKRFEVLCVCVFLFCSESVNVSPLWLQYASYICTSHDN